MREAKTTKILMAARSVFLRYGYRRVNMSDLAEAAGMSRPALYVFFRNKEQIFTGVFLQWIAETVAEVETAMAAVEPPREKIARAFDIWAVRTFETTMASPEARELMDCSFGFAQGAMKQGYAAFEAAITPVLATLADTLPSRASVPAEGIAHILATAVRGFKQTAATADELRQLIRQLLLLCLGPD